MSVFDTINFQTPQGADIKKLLERRLQQHREANDGINVTPLETAAIRGRIAEIQHLLAVAPPVVALGSYYEDRLPTGDRR